MTTCRFNTEKKLRETAIEQFPNADIAFLKEWRLKSEYMDVVLRSKEKVKYTGQKIKISNFKGFSPNFENLTEGSVHKVIETPERYKDGKSTMKGVWVEGVYEPAKVLVNEYYDI